MHPPGPRREKRRWLAVFGILGTASAIATGVKEYQEGRFDTLLAGGLQRVEEQTKQAPHIELKVPPPQIIQQPVPAPTSNADTVWCGQPMSFSVERHHLLDGFDIGVILKHPRTVTAGTRFQVVMGPDLDVDLGVPGRGLRALGKRIGSGASYLTFELTQSFKPGEQLSFLMHSPNGVPIIHCIDEIPQTP